MDEQQAPPPHIWLQWYGDGAIEDGPTSIDEITWERHQVFACDVQYEHQSTTDAKVTELEASKTYWQAEALLNHFCTEHASNKRQIGHYCTVCAKPFVSKMEQGKPPLKYSEQQARITALESQLATADARVVEAVRETWAKAKAKAIDIVMEIETHAPDWKTQIVAALESAKEGEKMQAIEITGVWLMRKGGENDPHAQVEVHIETADGWQHVITEPLSANFSHAVSPDGIRKSPLSDWNHRPDTAGETNGC